MSTNEYIPNNLKSQINDISEDIKSTLCELIKNDRIHFNSLNLSKHKARRIETIIITGTGNEYNIAKSAAYNIEMLTGKNTIALNSYEMMSNRATLNKSTLVIILSPEGENQPALESARRAKNQGAMLIAITDKEESEVAEFCKNKIEISNNGSVYTPCKEYLYLALLGLFIGQKTKNLPKLTVSVTLKIAQMLVGATVLSDRSKNELSKALGVISRYNNLLLCGFGADEGIADTLAQAFRRINRINANSIPLCQIDFSITAQPSCLVIAIISSGAYTDIVNHRLTQMRENGINTLIFTTENISSELCIKDSIVTVTDSIPLFNPVILAASILQTAILAYDDEKDEILSA